MASSTIKDNSAPRPAVSGWEIGFRVKGYGLAVIVPCDTRKYNLTVNSGAQVFVPSTGWSILDGTWQITNKGSYYLVRNAEQTVVTDEMVDSTYLLNITMTVSLK